MLYTLEGTKPVQQKHWRMTTCGNAALRTCSDASQKRLVTQNKGAPTTLDISSRGFNLNKARKWRGFDNMNLPYSPCGCPTQNCTCNNQIYHELCFILISAVYWGNTESSNNAFMRFVYRGGQACLMQRGALKTSP